MKTMAGTGGVRMPFVNREDQGALAARAVDAGRKPKGKS